MKCQRKDCSFEGELGQFVPATLTAKDTGLCKGCKAKQDKKYQEKHKVKKAAYDFNRWRTDEKVKDVNRKAVSQRRFGLDADEFVKNKSCEMCGMTNPEHKAKWSQQLNINHKNNKGRKASRLKEKPDNSIANLQILCRACHCTYSNLNERKYGK